ncbi:MAG TPA: DNA polymerase domain-containing protein, partial [Saprospiraceae bacterium]|nr:DNA polymerase domain-containing protein [Saprospiraceae bacterium]
MIVFFILRNIKMSSDPDTDNELSDNSEYEDEISIDKEISELEDSTKPRTVIFKTFYWKFEDTEDGTLEIHIAGRTADNKSVHCIVQNFTPFVYLELPKRIRWDKAKCLAVFNYFQKIMKSEGPLSMQLLRKYRLKYKKLINTIRMTFPTQKAAASIGSRCRNSRNGFSIDGVGFFKAGEIIVHEINIDPILKFTASKKLKLASWVSAKETIRGEDQGLSIEDRKYSTADIDLYADWLDVEDWVPPNVIVVKPVYFSFDIECNSKNHNSKLPDPTIPENFIFQIAVTYGVDSATHKKHIFSLFNPHDIKGADMTRCKIERELLLKFMAFIQKVNPDIFYTYNGMKFDWGYIIARAELNGIYLKFAQITRIIGKRPELMKSRWSSSAYGEQEFRYLDPMGRTNVDVLLEIERNYKLPKYNLDFVGEFFLKENKEGVTARQLFMLVQLTIEITPLVEDLPKGVVKKSHRIAIKKRIQEILPMRRCHGIVKKYRESLMNVKTGGEFRDRVRDAMTITGSYNIQDTVLPVKLAEKLSLWTTMEEISNCQNVPMSYLHTRGQQVKVVAQVFRETIFNDLIISYKERIKDEDKVRYEGAVVIEANPGDYDNVICTDFESLYPSMIIAYNICYTTLVEDTDPISDELCHVLKISSHIGCVHDVKKRKKKEKDILCHDRVYRFKKVIFHPDGTIEGEGLMPRLERRLLTERKVKKKELAKLQATLKMAEGLAEEDDFKYYNKMGWDIIKKGSLNASELEILKVSIAVVNAQQLALKVSANSVSEDTPIPCLVNGKFRYLPIDKLAKENSWKLDKDGNDLGEPIDNLKVWSDIGFTKVNYIFRHPRENLKLKRVLTHTGCVDVTKDHSLLDERGVEITTKDVQVGDYLLHKQVPLPKDTPIEPMYVKLSDEDIVNHKLGKTKFSEDGVHVNENLAFAWGLFFAEGTAGTWGSLEKAKSSLIIYNQDRKLLKRARDILTKEEDIQFEISRYYDSAKVYHLKPTSNGVQGAVKSICDKYRGLFYDNRCRKIIPDIILRASLAIRTAFFVGYYAGDGNRKLERGIVIQNKGSTGTAQIFYLMKSLGYLVSISYKEDNIYRLQCSTKFKNLHPTAIKSIHNSPIIEINRDIKTDIIRNDAKIELKDGLCQYKGIDISCERVPRQKLLDSLDLAQLKVKNRGKIIKYSTKTKKIIYQCQSCYMEYPLKLQTAHEEKVPRYDRSCNCKVKYYDERHKKYSKEKYVEYVYDIETKSHHFAGGVGDMIVHNSMYGTLGAQNGPIPLVEGAETVTAMGRDLITDAIAYMLKTWPDLKLVYGDTDSSMVTFVGKTTAESFELGDKVSKAATHYLKCKLIGIEETFEINCPSEKISYRIDKYPRAKMEELSDEMKVMIYKYDGTPVNLQFENLYKRYLLLSKKRYVAHAVNRKGQIVAVINKGVVLARRDNCLYLRDSYKRIKDGILDRLSQQEIMYILYDQIQKLFTRQIPTANLILYTGVKTIMNYAKKKEINKGNGIVEKVFLDEDKEPIEDPIGPLDPRLVYPNLPQVLLSLKMLRRGDDVPPNTRLEYIYLRKEGATHQGEKAEDYTFYKENRDIYDFKPDYLHYIEKQLSKPVTEILNVKYPPQKIPYEKLENHLDRLINNLDELLQHRVKDIKFFEKSTSCEYSNVYKVGWSNYGINRSYSRPHRVKVAVGCEKCSKMYLKDPKKRCSTHKSRIISRTYYYKKKTAQVEYILASMEIKRKNPKAPNQICPIKYSELYQIALRWKSRNIIDRLYAQHGLRKRPAKRATQTGE